MKPFHIFFILLISYSLSAQKRLDFERLYSFKNGYALVQNGNKIGYIDSQGNPVGAMDVSQNIHSNDGTLFQGKSVYINQEPGTAKHGVRQYTGEYVIDPEFHIVPFHSFFIIKSSSLDFMKPTTYKVMNEDGTIIYSHTFKKHISDAIFPISNEVIGLKDFEKDNSYYAVKSLISDFQSHYIYKKFGTLQNGFIKAQRYSEEDGKFKWGFLNEKGEEVIDFIYTAEPSDFSEEKAVVESTVGKYGYIDTTNKIILEPQFIEASKFVGGKALVRIHNVKFENGKKNFGYRLINPKGEIIFDLGEFSTKRHYGINNLDVIENGNLILLKSNLKMFLFNLDTLEIKEMPYFKMERYNSNRALVFYIENKLSKTGYVDEKGDLIFYAEKKNQF